MMARPEDFDAFVRAAKAGKVGLNWGNNSIRGWAESQGWPTPLFGIKKALIKKMTESPENFSEAMISGGIDVYIPDDI